MFKYFASILAYIFLSFSCRKLDSLPQDAYFEPLTISWDEDGISHRYKVGENALYSRSFTVLNSDENRVFVHEFYINDNNFIRISLASEKSAVQIEQDLEELFQSNREIFFETVDYISSGKSVIEFLENRTLTASSITNLNLQNKIKILQSRKVQISNKFYYEAEISFSCTLINVSDNSTRTLNNGKAKIAIRYK
ncbi:hypothetical protein JCM31826_00630 [Thermaurantimonas aggregans]|uniref:Uncharacterized protein n=1 Tax=Thermaurantimonas aggregans TaxID=2173829 RepID=A0A401XHT9_9FLAO|nr:hypothetical protein [Thermaurantimonas aggregans]MCX8149432.1 hypothetical protein [Thermaurantimonas aggregans]GCD76581.1 hypothetical protein JCM31826_00630 [Thermaurantimonas aggregans]